ncbi:MAG: protein kinase [Deltaproteobacteria bacterium]|nr:protein kinase [Deltaproteobacteria bacterium]
MTDVKEPTTDRSGLATGQMLGRYEIIAPLARGGMGAVYLARVAGAGGFKRLFAIKVMHPHLAEESEFIQMLLDEARLASRIHHPNAVAIVDVADGPSGLYLVMDYIDGITLAKIRSTPNLEDEVKTRVAMKVLVDALHGLHAAHDLTDDDGNALNIVHRDVSPQNILLGTDGVARITDFGIALAASRITSSRPGIIKGKPGYMAPEQVLAYPVDRRADVFAVGIILYEFLTRGRLFKADSDAATLLQVVNLPIPRPSSRMAMPQSLEDVCLRALERDVDKRYPTCHALAQALHDALTREGWLLGAHEVTDYVKKAFAEDIAARKAMIRDRNRALGGTGDPFGGVTPAPVTGARPTPPMPQNAPEAVAGSADTLISGPSLRTPAVKNDSLSIPAIEVRPGVREAPPSQRLSAEPGSPRQSLGKMAAAGVLVLAGAGLGAWAMGRSGASQGPAATPSPVPAPVVGPTGTTPAHTTPPVPEPSAPAPEPAPVVAPTPAHTVESAPQPSVARVRRRHDDAGVAAPRVPAPERPSVAQPPGGGHPTIESNPYLQRH